MDENPHIVAAFIREAVGWHRFWSTYAPHFTQLTQLNMRMPSTFDSVGSVRLAKLLDAAKGWCDVHYANENGGIDVGGFVRRTWICQDPKASISEFGESEAEREKVQFEKGVKLVEEAMSECEGVELEVQPTTGEGLETGLRDGYRRRVRCVAEEAWRSRVREYGSELADHIATSTEDEAGQHVLESTRTALQGRVQPNLPFQPEDIFTHDPNLRNNIGLVNHTVDYAAEEHERRSRPDPVEPKVEDASDDSIYNPSPSPQTRDSAYDAAPAQDSSTPGVVAHDIAAQNTTNLNELLPGILPAWSSQPQNVVTETSAQVNDGVIPTDSSSPSATLQQPDPANSQLPGISNTLAAPPLHVPTDLEQILATLSQSNTMDVQQPIAPLPQVAHHPEVDRLLVALQENAQQGHVAGFQDHVPRWSVDAVVGEGEDDVDARVGHGLVDHEGLGTTSHQTDVHHPIDVEQAVPEPYGATSQID